MTRNRKHESATTRFGSVLRVLIICLLIGGAAAGYVGQQTRLYVLGGQVHELELKLNRLRRDNAERSRLLDTLQSPGELDARVKQMNLGLVPPRPDQILRLTDHPADQTGQSADRLYADRDAAGSSLP